MLQGPLALSGTSRQPPGLPAVGFHEWVLSPLTTQPSRSVAKSVSTWAEADCERAAARRPTMNAARCMRRVGCMADLARRGGSLGLRDERSVSPRRSRPSTSSHWVEPDRAALVMWDLRDVATGV